MSCGICKTQGDVMTHPVCLEIIKPFANEIQIPDGLTIEDRVQCAVGDLGLTLEEENRHLKNMGEPTFESIKAIYDECGAQGLRMLFDKVVLSC